MSKINVSDLVKKMSEAAGKVLKDKWPEAKTYAEMEFKKLGETIVAIQKAKLAGEIDEEDARILIDMQKNAMRSVMLAVEGLGIIAVETAINSALGVVRKTVNTALGWPLL
jgi:transcription initiation factor IIE alpha subunit